MIKPAFAYATVVLICILATSCSYAPGISAVELAGKQLRVNTSEIGAVILVESDLLISSEHGFFKQEKLVKTQFREIARAEGRHTPFHKLAIFAGPADASYRFDLSGLRFHGNKHYYIFAGGTHERYFALSSVDSLIQTYSNPRSRMIHNFVLRQWPLYLMLLLAGLIALKAHRVLAHEAAMAEAKAQRAKSEDEVAHGATGP